MWWLRRPSLLPCVHRMERVHEDDWMKIYILTNPYRFPESIKIAIIIDCEPMQVSWYFRAVVHTLLVCGMTYHAVDVDSHLLPYSRNLYAELWRLLNGGDQDQPVNLFTIRHAVEHVHMVLANYFALPNVALGKLHVAPEASVLVYVEPLSWIYALTSAAQWVALLRFLSFNPRTYILGLTLKRGAPQVVEFLIGVCPLFVGYVLCGTIMYGATVPRFAGMATTATTLFALANGDEIRDTFVSLPWHGQVSVYLYSYIVIFAYVVLMVCIGIMEDAFFTSAFPSLWKEKTLSEDEWTRVVDLIRAETMAKYPDIADKQGEILSHVHRQLF
ncbi:hypothetical protein DYB32_006007 [Aphanomyces invadans]|uniref:Polycystin cation channel PKD1/PKD2 domain-containing protein n=1 Tax=Aphanomyces invadans TaxID=157072 RepID=A0A418ASL1_9STRA|nr:hypothetical protein DYB32_006007 [Aphanomyces invadans]